MTEWEVTYLMHPKCDACNDCADKALIVVRANPDAYESRYYDGLHGAIIEKVAGLRKIVRWFT